MKRLLHLTILIMGWLSMILLAVTDLGTKAHEYALASLALAAFLLASDANEKLDEKRGDR